MKKISLNVTGMNVTEVLSREELKNVIGGLTTNRSDRCNDICRSGGECGGSCPYCVEVPNWYDMVCSSQH
jgi:hypothetical protein